MKNIIFCWFVIYLFTSNTLVGQNADDYEGENIFESEKKINTIRAIVSFDLTKAFIGDYTPSLLLIFNQKFGVELGVGITARNRVGDFFFAQSMEVHGVNSDRYERDLSYSFFGNVRYFINDANRDGIYTGLEMLHRRRTIFYLGSNNYPPGDVSRTDIFGRILFGYVLVNKRLSFDFNAGTGLGMHKTKTYSFGSNNNIVESEYSLATPRLTFNAKLGFAF